MSPVIETLAQKKIPFFVVHTNQHYSRDLDAIFFEELNLDSPKYSLGVGSGRHGEMTGLALQRIEKVFFEDRPDVVLVQGDTNSVLAGALVASKMGIPVGHVEAGLRSFDRMMPEETNRVIVDHISDFLFVPTRTARENLIKEGVEEDRIFLTGNTVVDAVNRNVRLIEIGQKQRDNSKNYAVLTLHRPSNVDDPKKLQDILNEVAKTTSLGISEIRFYIHPRTQNQIKKHRIIIPNEIISKEPIGYLEMLSEIKGARLVLTDSGGIQEEACILKVPTVTIRENTERPETVEVSANALARTDDEIYGSVMKMLDIPREWQNPFGKGDAAVQIISILSKSLKLL